MILMFIKLDTKKIRELQGNIGLSSIQQRAKHETGQNETTTS